MGTCLTVDGRGMNGEGRVLATARVYTQMYEFRPHSEVIIALRLRCFGELTLSSEYVCCVTKDCEPLCQRGGVAYIECAAPHKRLALRGLIVGNKGGTLLVTYTMNAR